MTTSLLPSTQPPSRVPATDAEQHRSLDASLCGRRVRLEPLSRRHIPALHAIATADNVIMDGPSAARR